MAFTTGSTAVFLASDGNLQSGNGAWFQYCSSDSAVDIYSTGYFKGAGVGSRGGTPIGFKLGDILVNVESTAGVTPGRVTLHSFVASTANGSTLGSTFGYDMSVSSAATT